MLRSWGRWQCSIGFAPGSQHGAGVECNWGLGGRWEAVMFPHAQLQLFLHACAPSPVGKSSLLQGIAFAWKEITKSKKSSWNKEQYTVITFLYFLLRKPWVYFFQQDASVCSTGHLCRPGLRALVPFSSSLFSQQLERDCCFWGTPFSLSLCQDAE